MKTSIVATLALLVLQGLTTVNAGTIANPEEERTLEVSVGFSTKT